MHLRPYGEDRQLSVALPIANASSRFKLPRGWSVRKVLRRDRSHYDMYYIEPGTGKKFRSTKEVERYLNGEGYPRRAPRTSRRDHVEFSSPRRSSRRSNHNYGYQRLLLSAETNRECRKMLVSGGKLFSVKDESENDDSSIVDSGKAAHILPDGWIVEEVPRYNTRSSGWDRYYYEPETGRKFRSLVDVEKHLAELEDNAPLSKALKQIQENKPLSKVFKLEKPFKNSTPRKKCICGEDAKDSSFLGPPMKVNWVFASSQPNTWNPLISETLVTDSVKKQWTDRFAIFMNDGISSCQSTCA